MAFDAAAVLAYDALRLAVGQPVTFEMLDAHHAGNISVRAYHGIPHAPGKDTNAFRYMGFEHQGNVRAYRFDLIQQGEARQSVTVEIDLALLLRHHVTVQEGPALCLRLLATELASAGAESWGESRRSITEQNMQAYVASRPVPVKGGRRAAAAGVPAFTAPPA